jgi:hypothetical protein
VTLVAHWLDRPPDGWDHLVREDRNAGPGHDPALVRAVTAVLPELAPAFLAVEEGGALMGGMPVVVARRAALHWIHALPFTLPCAPLATGGAHDRVDRLVAEALEARARDLRAVGGEWIVHRPAGPPIDRGALERLSGETRTTSTAVVDLSGGAAQAWRSVERGTRHEVSAARARGLSCAEEPAALDEAYGLYAAQAKQWGGHRLRPLALLERLLEGREPAARLFTVRDGGGLLAAVLTLMGRHEWMPWWSGAHPEARRRHAFALLLWSVAERAAAAGCIRLNLGGSAGRESVAAFKQALSARDEQVWMRWIAPVHAGAIGRAVAGLQARLRTGRARGERA